MTNSNFARVREIFDFVVDLPPSRQEEALREECGGDADLLREVRELLGHDMESTAVALPDLGRIRAEVTALNARSHDLVGKKIGHYVIQEQIGQGGMGTVFVANRTEDFESRVAIKVTRPGLANEAILKRFRDEMRFQASLGKHPSIAAMLDAGKTDDGLPYFVMEFVDGVRIDEYCDQQRLTTAERIELFRKVCSAVQFAHQNAVLHRDLKPSNILVATDGVPVLIDFGIAKLADDETNADKTRTEMPVFTPDYASPEQIRGEMLTTASDVYSLGVVFYELLTGHRPYRVTANFPHRIAEAIERHSPDRPSDAILRKETIPVAEGATRDVTPADVGEARSTAITRLQRILRGDLDTISLMALRKEPDRRYATAAELSADLGRYLDGMPVLARSDTVGYRAKKFVTRNKLSVALSLLVLVSLIGGIVGTTVGMASARRQRDEAEQNFALALDSVDRMLIEVGNEDLVDVPQMAEVRKEILEDALEFYQEFIRRRGDDRRVASQLGRVHMLVGSIYEKLYRYDDAMASYQTATDLFEQLHRRGAATARDLERLVDGYFSQGVVLVSKKRFQDAIAIFERAISHSQSQRGKRPNDVDLINEENKIRLMLGQVVAEKDARAGEEIYREALQMQRKLVSDHSEVIQYQDTLALICTDLAHCVGNKTTGTKGRDEAEQLRLESLDIRKCVAAAFPNERRSRSKLAAAYNGLGKVYWEGNRYRLSAEMYRKGIDLQEQLLKQYPGYPHQKDRLGDLYGNLGVTLASFGKFTESKSSFESAIAIQRELCDENPEVAEHFEDLAKSLRSLAHVNNELTNPSEAERLFAEELQVAEFLVENFPEDDSYREDLTKSLAKLAMRQEQNNQPEAAAATNERALAVSGHTADAYFHRGQNFARKKNYARAIEDFGEAIKKEPSRPEFYVRRGEACRDFGRLDQAVDDLTKAIELDPDASYYRRRGSCYRDLEQFENALTDYARAIELKPDYATAWNSKGVTYEKMGRLDDAAQSYTRALEFATDDPVLWENRADIYLEQKKWNAAADDYAEAIKLQPLPAFYEARAYAQRRQGNYEKAIEDYTDALRLDANMTAAIAGRAWTYAQLEEWSSAEQDYGRYVSLRGNSIRCRYERILVHLAQNRIGEFHAASQALFDEIVGDLRENDNEYPSGYFSKLVTAMAAVPSSTVDWRSAAELLPRRLRKYADEDLTRIALELALVEAGNVEQGTKGLDDILGESDLSTESRAVVRCFLGLAVEMEPLDWPIRTICRARMENRQ